MNQSIVRVLSALVIAYSTTSTWAALSEARFIPLGDFPGGEFGSEALDVSADGSIVVGTGISSFPAPGVAGAYGFEAFRWTMTGGMQGLGTELSVRGTLGSAIAGDGSRIVGLIGDAYPARSVFSWSPGESMQRLSGCSCVGLDDAEAVSYDGSVVVGRMALPHSYHAYRWTSAAGAIDLGVLSGGNESAAYAVSRDGSVVVGASATARFSQAFRWTEEQGMVLLGSGSNRGSSSAYAMSSDASVIVGELESQAVRWTIDGNTIQTQILGDLTGGTPHGYARGISADGRVIVGSYSAAGGFEGFLWTQELGMRSLSELLVALGVDLRGYKNLNARNVSADGTMVVGTGTNPAGKREGFVAIIPTNSIPEPSSFILLLFPAALLGGHRIRRHGT